jgi:hypothetical protein
MVNSLTIELALEIEDPAGIDQVNLASAIMQVFGNRDSTECVLMRHSLLHWAKQFPRKRSVGDIRRNGD